MRALVFDPAIPRYLAAKALGRAHRAAFWGWYAPLQLRQVSEPRLPGEEWVRINVRLGGICGSDLHLIRLETSVATSAFASFPCVVGHENVGTIGEVGRAVNDLAPGQRVTIEPLLPCAARALMPCPHCAIGEYNRCLSFATGSVSPGLMIGACRDTGGSWGEQFVAHRSQVLPVPDQVSDEHALLAEPMACALHPLLRVPPQDGATVLVIGGGVIGQCAVAALRALGSRVRIIALVKHAFQGAMAERLGADLSIRVDRRDAHVLEVAAGTGAAVRRSMLGRPVLVGGADYAIECVGSARSLNDGLRLTRKGGVVILLGLAAVPRTVDWTPLWLNEQHVVGSFCYAWETYQARRRRTMEVVLDWMASRIVDVSALATHRFPLSQYREALQSATGKGDSSAFKVALSPAAARSPEPVRTAVHRAAA